MTIPARKRNNTEQCQIMTRRRKGNQPTSGGAEFMRVLLNRLLASYILKRSHFSLFLGLLIAVLFVMVPPKIRHKLIAISIVKRKFTY